MLHRSLAALLCLLGISVAAPVHALTLLVSGVIDFVDDPLGIGSPAEGAAFSVVIEFPIDVSAPPGPGGLPGSLRASNVFDVPPGQYAASVGTWTVASGPTTLYPDPRLEVDLFWNPGESDAVGIRTFSQEIGGSGLDFVTGGGRVTTTVFLEGPHGTLSPALLLGEIAQDPSVWTAAYFDLEYYLNEDDNHDASYASGLITSITVVPEPATALLLAGALAGLAAARRYAAPREARSDTARGA